ELTDLWNETGKEWLPKHRKFSTYMAEDIRKRQEQASESHAPPGDRRETGQPQPRDDPPPHPQRRHPAREAHRWLVLRSPARRRAVLCPPGSLAGCPVWDLSRLRPPLAPER